jgi:two-component system response regulator AtoC
MHILLVEDEKITRISLGNTLRKEGFQVMDCERGDQALLALKQQSFDLILTDLRLPGHSGMDILERTKALQPQAQVILMTAYASVDTAVEALKKGAYDYLTKPFSPESLLVRLRNLQHFLALSKENLTLKNQILSYQKRVIIGNSPAIHRLMEMITLVADRESTTLIVGESGSGKELVARALHDQSPRAQGPFIAVNCAAIPETLFESELFGHEKGAFSGASRQHPGHFERAETGTLFIDEVDDFPLHLQVKLLRVLQERHFQRVGGTEIRSADVRIIAASKVDLWEQVQQKKFREDLFFRLNIVPILVPPLRDRLSDLPLLIDHFLEKYQANPMARERALTLLPKFQKETWPGNVRQLENIIQRLAALPELSEDLLLPVTNPQASSSPQSVSSHTGTPVDETYGNYEAFLEQKNLEILNWALERAHFNISRAAKILGIPRSTLRSKLEKHHLMGKIQS